MEQIELGEANVSRLRAELGRVEAEWQVQQAGFRSEAERLQAESGRPPREREAMASRG